VIASAWKPVAGEQPLAKGRFGGIVSDGCGRRILSIIFPVMASTSAWAALAAAGAPLLFGSSRSRTPELSARSWFQVRGTAQFAQG
jgi:hypothetical protein